MSLALCRTIGDRRLSVFCLEELAGIASAQGQPERAARLFGAAEAARRLLDTPLPLNKRPRYERLVAAARPARRGDVRRGLGGGPGSIAGAGHRRGAARSHLPP